MQFVMYSGKLHIYQHSFFITYDICVCKHVFPITILQNIMCKCAKSFSFWGTSSPDTLPGLCPWTSLGDFRPRTSLLAIVYCRPLWGNPPPKKNSTRPKSQRHEFMPYLLGPNHWTLQILLLSHPWTSLYPSIPWLQNSRTIVSATVHSKLD